MLWLGRVFFDFFEKSLYILVLWRLGSMHVDWFNLFIVIAYYTSTE